MFMSDQRLRARIYGLISVAKTTETRYHIHFVLTFRQSSFGGFHSVGTASMTHFYLCTVSCSFPLPDRPIVTDLTSPQSKNRARNAQFRKAPTLQHSHSLHLELGELLDGLAGAGKDAENVEADLEAYRVSLAV